MTWSWSSWSWKAETMATLAITGAIIAFSDECNLAQITPDKTLGAESSVVTPLDPDLPIDAIGGGAQRRANLFHSFREFNVSEGRGAYFFSPKAEIQNILTRVTGSNPSKILGTLGTFGKSNPNLFLMNPNGIIFGPNASLDVGGSFVGTTANGIHLGETGRFSASEPGRTNLLSVNPSALFFNAVAAQAIVNQSTATTTVTGASTNGLQVPNGRSLLLVGGDVSLEGGKLTTTGGRVELGGVAGSGTVGLNGNGSNLSLSFPNNLNPADVSLTNSAEIDVTAGNGGSIAINAQNLDILEGSNICAGIGPSTTCGSIASDFGSVGSQAGDIILNIQKTLTIAGQGSQVENSVNPNAIGNGGNINIQTGSFSLAERASLDSSTYGQGDSGNVLVEAKEAVNLVNSNVFSNIEAGAEGQGGGINITARSLSLSEGAQLQSGIRGASEELAGGQGNAGDVNIDVQDTVTIAGVNDKGSRSAIYSDVEAGAVGDGGDINITARSFSLKEGTRLITDSSGQGDAGSVLVQANEAVNLFNSDILSSVRAGAKGQGGKITINAGSLSLSEGAQLQTLIRGASETLAGGQGNAGDVTIDVQDTITIAGVNDEEFRSGIRSSVGAGAIGNAGSINITAGSLSLSGGASLNSSTFGTGDAGGVVVQADSSVSLANGNIFSSVGEGAEGKAGSINITAGSLSLSGGASLSSSTFGTGDAGGVVVQADSSVSLANSDIFSNVGSGAEGKGGKITINAGSLSLSEGAQLQTLIRGASETLAGGQGNAGDVTIDVQDTITIAGVNDEEFSSGIRSSVGAEATGNAGSINITAESLFLTEGAFLNSSTYGQGDAGSISVQANGAVNLFNSDIYSNVETGAKGQGGGITINAGSLSLSQGAQLQSGIRGASETLAGGKGNAGNIKIDVQDIVTIAGVNENGLRSAIYSDVEAGAVGDGGDITIKAGSLALSEGTSLNSSTYGTGDAGNVLVQADGFVSLANSDIFSPVKAGAEGQGGDITINTRLLSLTDGATVRTSVSKASEDGTRPAGQGDAGNIRVNASESVELTGTTPDGQFSSGLFSDTKGAGAAGNLTIDTGKLSLRGGALMSTMTFGDGKGGTLTVTASDSVELTGTTPDGQFSSGLFSDTKGAGAAGNLTIDTGKLSLRGGAVVAARTFSGGQGGTLTVTASDSVELTGTTPDGQFSSGLSTTSLGTGDAGDLEVTAPAIQLDDQARIEAETESGQGGDIKLQVQDVRLRHGSEISTTAGTQGGPGSGGNISIKTDTLVGLENSDITANAFEGRGGFIQIEAQGILGLERREKLTENSDITAFSEKDPLLSGTVEINTPDTELQSSLTQLSANFINPDQVVAGSCLARRNAERGSFTVTGTGGLPRSPYEAISGRYNVTGVQPIQSNGQVSSDNAVIESAPWKLGDPIHEAQGMVVTADGRTIVGTNSQLAALAKVQKLVCRSG